MGIYQGKFLMSILFGVCIATLRLLLLSFNVGYNPVDYGVYKGAYGLLVEGLSLYGNDVYGAYVEHGLPFVYTPFSLILLVPWYYLPEPVGIFTWTTINASLLFWIVKISLLNASTVRVFIYSSIFSLFNIIAQHFMFGQINIILCLLCLYDMTRDGGKVIPKGSLVGVAAGIKLTPALFILFFLYARRWREFYVSSCAFTATVALGFVFTPANTVDYFGQKIFTLSSVVDLGQNFSTSGNSSLQGMISRWLGYQGSLLASFSCLLAMLLAFKVAKYYLDKGDNLAAASLIGVTSCLVSPVSWLHHWVWAVPAIIWLARQGGEGVYLALIWASFCLMQGTDLGDFLATLGFSPFVYEPLRSSLVLCGVFWIIYMSFLSKGMSKALRFSAPLRVSRFQ